MDINTIRTTIKLDSNGVNEKINALLEQKKIKMAIKNKKNSIDHLYKQLGKVFYSNKENGKYDDLVQELCEHIKFEKANLKKLIKRLECISKINKQSDYSDFKDNNAIEQFKVPDKAPEPIKNTEGLSLYKFCPKCQIGNNPDSENCVYCGTKFN
jgi:hypothetical protein